MTLYPSQGQILIDKVFPGTGWRVKHYGSGGGDPENRGGDYEEAYRGLSSELGPFMNRIFARAYPTKGPASGVVHHEEWHVKKRPEFDLGSDEYYSVDENLTGLGRRVLGAKW